MVLRGEEAGCEGFLDLGHSREGCDVWEVEVGEAHFGGLVVGRGVFLVGFCCLVHCRCGGWSVVVSIDIDDELMWDAESSVLR